MSDDHPRLQDHISKPYKEVRRLRAKTIRVPGQRSRAVEVAASKAANSWHYSDILRAIETHTSGRDGTSNNGVDACADPSDMETFSDRSARRFPLEGHVVVLMKRNGKKQGPIQLFLVLSQSAPGRRPAPRLRRLTSLGATLEAQAADAPTN
ncbi:hypothetical protein BDM02DRAFT_3127119 [Thelephora ganbajun]|uniref:Uncharacterized protein n=1 Tax=Thelephora ganbajun TaxID=370292 RepID=A0ACB6ZNT1_THEGA|nr:hypothetical protein BDM02DRAFT_3127119 [Thelephora ganbajun]